LGLILILILTLAVGTFLRLLGMNWGLPNEAHLFSYHPDEIPILHGVSQLNVFAGHFNPHFFNYGTFYLHLVYVAVVCASGLGWVDPNFVRIEDVAKLHLIGRGVSVAFGVATILLTYLLGRRVANQRVGTLAAFLVALAPGLVANAHYATVDVTLTFWTALALLLMIHVSEGKDAKWVLWSGLVVGLCAATRYTAGLLLIPLLMQCRRHDRSGRMAVIAGLASLIGFLLGCPGAIFAFSEFRRDFLFEVQHSRMGSGLIFHGTGNGWWHHLTQNLPFATGLPVWLLLIACAGYLFCGRRGTNHREPLLVWLVVSFGLLGLGNIRFLRYLLPMLPPIMVLLSEALLVGWVTPGHGDNSGERNRWPDSLRRSAGLSLTCAILAAVSIVGWNAACQFARPDPRDQAAAWLTSRLQERTTVGLVTLPWFYTPPICPFNGGMKSQWQFQSWRTDAPFRLAVTGWDLKMLAREKPDIFVVSEFETRDEVRLNLPEPRAFLNRLYSDYTLVQEFKNMDSLPAPWLSNRFVPHDWLYPNPRVEIYRHIERKS